jgi:hypothetical protein
MRLASEDCKQRDQMCWKSIKLWTKMSCDYLAKDITKSISLIKDRMDPNISRPVNRKPFHWHTPCWQVHKKHLIFSLCCTIFTWCFGSLLAINSSHVELLQYWSLFYVDILILVIVNSIVYKARQHKQTPFKNSLHFSANKCCKVWRDTRYWTISILNISSSNKNHFYDFLFTAVFHG